MQTLNLETNVPLKCLKSSLAKHQENVKKKCIKKNYWDPTLINFKGFSKQKRSDCLAFGKDGIAYTARSLNGTLEKMRITSDSVGICATVIKEITYENSREKVFLGNDKLAALQGNRASLVDFMNMTIIEVIDNTKYYPTFGCSNKEGFLFTSKHHHRIDYWKPTELSTFARSDTEGSR